MLSLCFLFIFSAFTHHLSSITHHLLVIHSSFTHYLSFTHHSSLIIYSLFIIHSSLITHHLLIIYHSLSTQQQLRLNPSPPVCECGRGQPSVGGRRASAAQARCMSAVRLSAHSSCPPPRCTLCTRSQLGRGRRRRRLRRRRRKKKIEIVMMMCDGGDDGCD